MKRQSARADFGARIKRAVNERATSSACLAQKQHRENVERARGTLPQTQKTCAERQLTIDIARVVDHAFAFIVSNS